MEWSLAQSECPVARPHETKIRGVHNHHYPLSLSGQLLKVFSRLGIAVGSQDERCAFTAVQHGGQGALALLECRMANDADGNVAVAHIIRASRTSGHYATPAP